MTNQNNDTLIVDNQYFPCINWINASFHFLNIKIEQYESWQKMSFRNRMMVAGSNGQVQLSIPLEKGRGQRGLMKDVKISQNGIWQKQHLRTLDSCYGRSPFFEFYRDGVVELLQERQVFLLDLNMAILEWLQKVLENSSTIMLTETYNKNYLSPDIDLRNHFLPKNMGDTVPMRYLQVFEEKTGFLPNLSILDLLFCCGPNAKTLLKDNK